MSRHPAQAALASCILAVFVFSRVSVHLRMCMLDGDGGGLGALGSIKRRCFQSDRGSSVFTPKGFQETDIPPKRVPPRSPEEAAYGASLQSPARTAVCCPFTEEARISGHRRTRLHMWLQLS